MQQYVTLTIDGATSRAAKGASVLDAAMEYGICIPHLCHVPNLSDIGACRLCIVENVSNGRSKVTTSCTLKVQEGMVIRSNTEKIGDCGATSPSCWWPRRRTRAPIQDIAVRCGVKECAIRSATTTASSAAAACGSAGDVAGQGHRLCRAGQRPARGLPVRRRAPDFCKHCSSCIELCPMTITPCDGPMKPGEEHLCGKCEAQLTMTENMHGFLRLVRTGQGLPVHPVCIVICSAGVLCIDH